MPTISFHFMEHERRSRFPVSIVNVNPLFDPREESLPLVLRILDIHDFISDKVLLRTKNKAVSLKIDNSVVHVYKDEGMSSV